MTRGGQVEIEPDFAVRGHVTVENMLLKKQSILGLGIL